MKKSKRYPQKRVDPQKTAEPLEHSEQKKVEPVERSDEARQLQTVEPLERSDEARQLQEAAWPDMFANLQGAHAELVPQKTVEPLEHSDEARQLQEAAWPDMFANLQGAYAELVNTRFELERSSEQVAETRDLYQQMIASTSEAFFLTDLTGHVILTYPAAALLLECEEESILNQELAAICGASEVPATPWQLTQRERGGRLENLEVEVTTVKGARVPVSFNCTLMRDKKRKT